MEQKVIDAALAEIDRHGLKFTMDDITRRLHVSKTSLYKMVPSKNALIRGVLLSQIEESDRETKAILDSELGAEEKLVKVVRICINLFGFIGYIHDDLKYAYEEEWTLWESFRKSKISLVSSLIQKGAEEGIFRPLNPALIQQCLMAAVAAASDSKFLRENHLSYEAAIDEIMDVVLNGIKK